MTVFDRIKMNVVKVAAIICFVPDGVLPITPLPKAPFSPALAVDVALTAAQKTAIAMRAL